MVHFFSISRELRDNIYDEFLGLELPAPKVPLQHRAAGYSPFTSPRRRNGIDSVFEVRGNASLNFTRPRTASSALLCSNKQIRTELLEAIQRRSRQKKLASKLDVIVADRGCFFPTWTLLPAPVSHFDVLEINIRIMPLLSQWERPSVGEAELFEDSSGKLLLTLFHDLLRCGTNRRERGRPFCLSITTLKLNFTLQIDEKKRHYQANERFKRHRDAAALDLPGLYSWSPAPSIPEFLVCEVGVLFHHFLHILHEKRSLFHIPEMRNRVQKIQLYVEGEPKDEWNLS